MRLAPIVPFEPVLAKEIPVGREYIAQIKWDGVRILTYFDGKGVRLFNRKKNERTAHYPELTAVDAYSEADSFVLDGEVIALSKEGKPSFHQVMKRDGLRSPAKIERRKNEIPIFYMVFDLLYLNGKWLFSTPFFRREELLHRTIRGNRTVHLVESFPSPARLKQVVEEQGLEGIVVKEKSSLYLPGGKDRRWQKWKKIQFLIAIIGGMVEKGGELRSLLLGLPEEGGLSYIGHVGTGSLNEKERRKMLELLRPLLTDENPFGKGGEVPKSYSWLIPIINVKVRFLEWTEKGTLRQPVLEEILGEGEG
ncbi:ATP dependent DNA ligase domain protein [[Clostridium] ultunense Esp]|nr:ATP dependent DNA ligase domain protein [[Clostridium] ultunense Esp]